MNYLFPVILIIVSNIIYHVSSKAMSGNANPFASLMVTYLTAAAATAVFLVLDCVNKGAPLLAQFKNINWTGFALGIAIVGVEFGYIQAYRTGLNISIGSLVTSIGLAVILVAIGVLFYKEQITMNQIVGIILCICGFVFLSVK